MRVACPHCNVAYNIDDRRVPAGGLNVRCPKCRNTFPVRPAPDDGAVPLPAPGAAVAPARGEASSVPLPAPGASGSIPLPPPTVPGAAPPPSEGAPPPAPAIPLPPPFPAAPVPDLGASGDIPLPPPDEDPFAAAGDFPATAASEPATPLAEPSPPLAFDAPPLAEPPAAAPQPLAFGEVDFEAAPAPPSPVPFTAPPSPPPPPPPSEELEMLFGDGSAPAPPPAEGGAGGFRVRRRSGKIFGPFEQDQIVEMLTKGELLGNEDVSSDGGGSWTPIGSIPAFGEALRKLTAEPLPAPAPAPRGARAPFGERMAAAKITEGEAPSGRRWVKVAVAGAVVALLAAAGVGAGLMKYGSFFTKLFRTGDSARVATILSQARAPLSKDDYPSERASLELAGQAVAVGGGSLDAAALHAIVVAALELRHGAPPQAVAQARAAADRLDRDEKGEIATLAARLAVTLATSPGAATAQQETALEQASQKRPPDAELFALLGRAALARGDGARAQALFGRLEAMEPNAPRAARGLGLAAMARHDGKAARAAFEKALAKAPGHLPTLLELASLAEASGNAAEAEAHLAPLLAEGADAKLAPAERARALVLRGALLGRVPSGRAEAETALEGAVQADPRLVEARLALARFRMKTGDHAGAVSALDPVAQAAAQNPALAAVRIRALALAGRALDASTLAEQALQSSPGDAGLLFAKAGVLEASGKSEEAAKIYQDAAARDPGAFEPHLALGRIALARRDLATASAEISAAVEKGPRSPAVQAVRGDLSAAKGDAAGAETAYRAALERDADYAPAEIGLARLALARGDTAAAKARLERALVVDKHNVEGYVAYGTLLWKAKDLAGAEKAFQAAVDLQARNALALMSLGAVRLERNEDLDGAVQQLTAATNEDPRLAAARCWLGRALLRKGETPGAITQLRKAVELEPGAAEYHVQLGLALERSGALGEAVDAYRAGAGADPKYVEAHERLGALFATSGRCDEAVPAFERAIAAAPRTMRLRLALGDCQHKLRKFGEAVKTFREVLRSSPGTVEVLYRLARAVHDLDGPKAALPWYERAAREEAANPMPHYYLGYLYKERGLRSKAVGEFRRFLALKPDAEERKDIEAEIEDLGGTVRSRKP